MDLSTSRIDFDVPTRNITIEDIVGTLKAISNQGAPANSANWVIPVHPSHAIYLLSTAQAWNVMRKYAQWYNVRHPRRKIKWDKLSYPQMCEASELWTKGLL